ncbi:RNA polymerase sigma factor [Paenibacillus graminis]|uniref:RNA polymerase sigma factor n=1 Tax=Paenibacillus graminis TaxID=189425 RepID=UPI002DBA425A|nr:RNA polymerase sigma factor [Paenibacillus graminis]MEC0172419.1 RNA polymerase sigma factor [Paenibacillus graminis]
MQEHVPDVKEVEAVIIRVQKGETEQYRWIVAAFQQPVYRYCCRLLGNRQDAEDAVQDILVKAYQSLRRYKPTVGFSAWLYRIAWNHCLNLLRRQRLQTRIMRFFRPEAVSAGPEQLMDKRLYSPALSAALAQLSLEERNILVLRVFEELTFQEMGEILNSSPNALHKRMERIKQKVRASMEAEEGISWDEKESAMSTKI